MDGSCNGLQHYSALGRDEFGAASVNVLPNEIPADVYSIVLNVVVQKVTQDARGAPPPSGGHQQTTSADRREVANLCLHHNVLKRSTVKQTVMTICYGVTALGAQRQVTKHLEDMLGTRVDGGEINQMGAYVSRMVLDSVDEVFERAMKIKKWFDVVSQVLAKHNVPCCWISPIGLAISQPYFEESSKIVKTATQSITLKVKNVDGPVDGRHQKCGFPPNFVHSLDASHMMMVALRMDAEKRRFAAVHDSFWTHACDVDAMNKHIRETFIELHSQPILEDLDQNFRLLLGKKHLALPRLPPKANLDITKCLESLYFFD